MGYSCESKGFRLWLPDENKVIVSRDVKFIENWKNQSANIDSLLDNNSVVASSTKKEKSEFVDIESSIPFVEPPNDGSDIEDNNDAAVFPEPEQRPLRKRGRPKVLRTGQRGRPRKVYATADQDARYTNEDIHALLSEVPMKQAMMSPEVEQWHDAMVLEIKSILQNGT